MRYKKLETLSEAWAFYENVKAYPVEQVVMANRWETHSLRFDKFFVQEFLDYLDPDEETIRLTNFESWAKYCEDAVVSGYSGGIKRFWQLPRAVQRECYKFAQLHGYCNSPASKQWAHMESAS